MMLAAYTWERVTSVFYFLWVFRNAFLYPSKFFSLTYWSLTLHMIYFSIDKASPFAAFAVVPLHGVAFTGSISVLIGYSVMALFGAHHKGSWFAWETAMKEVANIPPTPFMETLVSNLVVHTWPVVALIIDLRLSWDSLRRCYASMARGTFTRIAIKVWFCIGFFAFGTTWQRLTFDARSTEAAADSLRSLDIVDRYQGPPYVRDWLGRGDDVLFAMLVKFSGTAFALIVNAFLLPRLIPSKMEQQKCH